MNTFFGSEIVLKSTCNNPFSLHTYALQNDYYPNLHYIDRETKAQCG